MPDDYQLPDDVEEVFIQWGWPSGRGGQALDDCLQVLKERSGQDEIIMDRNVRHDQDHIEFMFRSNDRMKVWKALIWSNRRMEVFEADWTPIHRHNY